MHSRRGTEIIGVFEFGYTEDDELHRRAKQGHDGMMRSVSSVAPDSTVMPRLWRFLECWIDRNCALAGRWQLGVWRTARL